MFSFFLCYLVANGILFSQKNLQMPDPSVTMVAEGVWRLRFGEPEIFTNEKFRVAPIKKKALEFLPTDSTVESLLNKILCQIKLDRTVISIPFNTDEEKIYGFGLDPGAYVQNGLRKYLSISSKVITKTGASHGPIPFFISSAGYGVFVETARVPFVHVGNLDKKSKKINPTEKSQLETSVEALYKADKTSGQKEIIFDLPGNNSGIDVYVFAGPGIREVVQRYNLFAGGGAMPPMYGLGMKYRTYTKGDKSTVLKLASELRNYKIPCDMIGLEPGWQTHAYSSSFVWSEERFPNHQKMIDQLISNGYKINLWEHAYIHPTSPLFEPLYNKSGDFLVWDGLVVDFADSVASEIFGAYHQNFLIDKGISGFKLDECDRQPVSDATPFNYPYISEFPSGIRGDQMTQLYGFLHQKSLYNEFRKSNLRSWNDVRATSALSSPLPFNLYSDAYALDEYLRQLVNASFTGLLWSPEVRKARNYPDLMNRVALAAFAPQMCLNIWIYPNPVWQQYDVQKNKANILLGQEEQEKIKQKLKVLADLRMSLLPYLYSAFFNYAETGLPPVRSLLLDFANDNNLYAIDDQFMFGESIMVAPFITDSCRRSVYFPKGVDWFDFFTKKRYKGGSTHTLEAQPGDIPLFVRENALIPFADPVQYVSNSTQFKIELRTYGEQPKSFTLIEDDGLTYNFEQGDFNKVKVSIENGQPKMSRAGSFDQIRYIFKDEQK